MKLLIKKGRLAHIADRFGKSLCPARNISISYGWEVVEVDYPDNAEVCWHCLKIDRREKLEVKK